MWWARRSVWVMRSMSFGSGHGDARYEALGMVSGVLQGVDAVRDLSNPGVLGEPVDRVFRLAFRTAIAFRRGGARAYRCGWGSRPGRRARPRRGGAAGPRRGAISIFMPGVDLAIESALATQSQSLRHFRHLGLARA